jgi:RNA polymerase sigma-70 factor (ECF subfamily)
MDVVEPGVAFDRDVDTAWRTHAPVAVRFTTALVGPHDAHDVTTTAFLRVVRQPGWRDLDALDRYLLRAVRNEAQNLYRQRRRRWERDLAGVRPTIADDVLINVDVFAAVAALSVRQRAVVYLAYWEDRTEADIADLLGLSRGSVHRTLSRARAALRKELE